MFCQEKDVYCLYLWSDLFGAMFVFITAFCTCDWNIALRGLLVSVDSMVAPLLFCCCCILSLPEFNQFVSRLNVMFLQRKYHKREHNFFLH